MLRKSAYCDVKLSVQSYHQSRKVIGVRHVRNACGETVAGDVAGVDPDFDLAPSDALH